MTLPEGVDAEGISARFDRGVLEVRIPKPAERKPRRVQIDAGSHESNGGAPAVEGTATEAK
jgi:HSP20 family protein